MRNLNEIVNNVAGIYLRSGGEAEEYLRKARELKGWYGPGFAVVYCWFYSVPQKWTQVEPRIFELGGQTDLFDMKKVLSMSSKEMAGILKPMIFRNEISCQLKNFCEAVKKEYGSWGGFAKALEDESIFELFQKLRKHRNIRITFKNLAAMEIIIGKNDNLLILDRYVAQIMGVNKKELARYRVLEKHFVELLERAKAITGELKGKGFGDRAMAKWSLAIWFDQSGILAGELIGNLKQ